MKIAISGWALDNKQKFGSNRSLILFTEDISDAPESELVCYCSGVTKGDILSAKRGGAVTLEDIKKATGACTLGRCRETNPRGR
ncbi:MAG: hypothetical protein AUK25_05065 [Desulfobacteraceae bacterium CG2_30_51_40]|nr:MAG: hypothetical protein AUK25_05065 [Desulfobacteraceae bacterium CG2_30_51_40]